MKILFQFGQFTTPRSTDPTWSSSPTQWILDDYEWSVSTNPTSTSTWTTQPTTKWTTKATTWSPPTAYPTTRTTTWQTAPTWQVTSTHSPLTPWTTRRTTRSPMVNTAPTFTNKPNTVKPNLGINCSSVASSSLPQDGTLILGVGLLLVLGVVSIIGIQFYSLYTKHSSKAESISKSQPYRGPSRRPSPEYQIAERVYPGLPSYEARVTETRFSDLNSSSSDFDLKGLTRGNEVPITKTKFKTYFTTQKAKKSTGSITGLPRNFKSNKVSFKRSPERYRRDNMPESDESYQ